MDRGGVVKLLTDPKAFNCVILCLYALNIVRWAVARSLADVCYWISAFCITATVTFLYRH
jgi:hypothetical protein